MRRDREGCPLAWLDDPEVIGALVAEAEQGYDRRSSAQFVSVPADEEIEALRRIVFRVPVEVRNAAQKRADEEKRSLGELAAAALDEYLARGAVREKSRFP
jgi:hypothetical protein